MSRITKELVRKRAEHNEGEIGTLEELTLHQQDIEKIEFLNKNCTKLKILYLQNNLISRIENLNRLKQLEYLNLALNNIEIIENLEGCESLKKLELTANFIGDLISVENLINLEHLEELYLIGNPCTEYEGYREFVIATLPQLKLLDGEEIGKAERIKSFQNISTHYKSILDAQKAYFERRVQEKAHALERKEALERKLKENDGFYRIFLVSRRDIEKLAAEFWNEKSPYTPESRLETYEFLKLQKEQKSGAPSKLENPKPRRTVFFAENGRPYNINEPKQVFTAFKNLDTSLIDCDVQTNYIRVTLRNKVIHIFLLVETNFGLIQTLFLFKVFQLALHEEVHPDRSSVQRSRVTGRLLIRMPKVKTSSVIESLSTTKSKRLTDLTKQSAGEKEECCSLKIHCNFESYLNDKKGKSNETQSNLLEVGPSKATVDWRNITKSECPRDRGDMKVKNSSATIRKDRENSPSFVDNPNVPPLE
ncbi:unnamed protein product [Rodentolepis nana]|uniref:LRRcap domain-containing protein n=1 Tax=Rodentolepis nana TaxID=102285 RepID=A0A0R3T5E8_RODNA|nr:unnamed protein product [Rodentolepis nana]